MKKYVLIFLSLVFCLGALTVTDVLYLRPTSLPASCADGELRFDTSSNAHKACLSDTWSTLGGGAISRDYSSLSGSTTLTTTPDIVGVDDSSGDVTLTLPTAVGNTGHVYEIKKTVSSSNLVILDANGSEVIDGATTVTMYSENESYRIASDGAGWEILNHSLEGVYLAATSSVKTPSASNNYLQMTGNSIVLTPGSWMLSGQINYSNGGVSPSWSILTAQWCTANGADTSSQPTLLTLDAGFTNGQSYTEAGGAGNFYLDLASVRVTVSSDTTIYLVPYETVVTAANGRVTTYIYAERIK